jgi:hypothetical protein
MRQLRIQAEIDAWPVCYPNAFVGGQLSIDKETLTSSLESRLARFGPQTAVHMTADYQWDTNPTQRSAQIQTLDWLKKLARETLRLDGLAARLQRPNNEAPGLAEQRWRFLSLRIPPDVLLAALASFTPEHPMPERVNLLHPLVSGELPTAHVHLHVGALRTTEEMWATLRDSPPPQGLILRKERLPERLWEDERLLNVFRPADERGRPGSRLSFAEALRRALLAEVELSMFLHSPAITLDEYAASELTTEQTDSLYELCKGRLLHEPEDGPRLARMLERIHRVKPTASSAQIIRCALERVDWAHNDHRDDHWLNGLLTQLIRVRTFFHQYCVVDASSTGLSAFRATKNRGRQFPKAGASSPSALHDSILRQLSSSLRVESVEIRYPGLDRRTLTKTTSTFQKIEQNGVEVGLVLSLNRSWDNDTTACNYTALSQKMYGSVQDTIEVLRQEAANDLDILRRFVGLDLAGDELAGPLWLAAPILKHARDELDLLRGRYKFPGVGLTLHVGEVFQHLAAGLRAIHEPLLFQLMRDGDRLGHALALGLDVERWCEQNPKAYSTRLARLFDLAWMLRALVSFDIQVSAADVLRIRSEIDTIESSYDELNIDLRIKGKSGDVYAGLSELRLVDMRQLDEKPDKADTRVTLRFLKSLHLSDQAWRWANTPVKVDTSKEVHILEALKTGLTQLIAQQQLVIEVNPSSNLLVAGLDSPLNQPIFHLRPVDLRDHRALPICLSADDPLEFATCFDDEVAYAWAGMVSSGDVPAGFARAWIDEAMRIGWRARFTRPLPRAFSM